MHKSSSSNSGRNYTRNNIPSFFALIAVVAVVLCALPVLGQEELYGNFACHDPSGLIKDGNRYCFFRTGSGIPFTYSTDLRNWTSNSGDRIFPVGPPTWVTAAVPGYDPNNWNWAPDVAYFNGLYHVYYSVSEWGTIDSVIGLVTSPSLSTPVWTDRGKVVQSDAAGYMQPETDTTAYNCIDPSILLDTNGTVWMTFGSYSSGILVTQIDPSTGLRMNTNSLVAAQVANNTGNRGWGSTIEGAFTYQHGGYYYLFVNYGGCCSGIESTYNIRVGRSTSVTGPYYDKDGIDMRDSGGTMLLESSGRFVGPGHPGILKDGENEWFTYHYYTWAPGAWAQLGLSRLTWDTSEWPVLPNNWSAFYPFNTDAREHSDWFDGSLQSGASIVAEDAFGKVLELDGTGYVALHEAVANCSTVATWVKWAGGGDWQRIFDFGNDTSSYMFLTPRANDGKMRFAIRNNGAEQIVSAPFGLPPNTWCHVAVTLDGHEGVMYLNGEAVATNSVTIRPWEMQARTNDIGRSKFADPGFAGCISSFRIFANALSADEVREVAYAHPALAHRYSFSADVRDSIGMAHGQLKGSATISNEVLKLTAASSDYAQLPGGLISGCGAVSIEFWADIGFNGNWARIFDFGNYSEAFGNSFLFLTSGINSGQYRMDMNGTTLDISGGTLNDRSVHVACVVDPASNYIAIYIDGQLVKQQTVSTPALSSVSKAWSFLGRSLFRADPYLNARIDEFRIYDGRLSPAEIAGNYAAGPAALYQGVELTMTRVVGGHDFEWPSSAAGFALEQSSALGTNTSWSPIGTVPDLSDGHYGLTLPATMAREYYRLRR